MLLRLFLLFVFVPLAELILLLLIAQVTSIWVSIGLVIVSGLIGAWMVKRAGVSVMRRIREKLAANQMPTESLADAGLILFAGGLLLTPGLITDVVGLSMLIPKTRQWYKKKITAWLRKSFQIKTFTKATGMHDEADVVDSYAVKKEAKREKAKDGDDDGHRVVYPDRIESGPFD